MEQETVELEVGEQRLRDMTGDHDAGAELHQDSNFRPMLQVPLRPPSMLTLTHTAHASAVQARAFNR